MPGAAAPRRQVLRVRGGGKQLRTTNGWAGLVGMAFDASPQRGGGRGSRRLYAFARQGPGP